MRPIIANINESNPRISRVSWGGILAGAFTMVSILFMLNLLGVGVGLTMADPTNGGQELAENIGMGTIIWWALSNLVAIFIGGMVAARMAGYSSSTDGGLHGFIAWSVYTVSAFIVFSSAIGFLFTGLNTTSGSFNYNKQDHALSDQLDRAKLHMEDQVNTSYNHAKKGYYQLTNPANRPNYDLSNLALDNRANSSQTDQNEPKQRADSDRENRNLRTLFPGQMYSSQTLGMYFNELQIQGDREQGYKISPGDDQNYFDEDYLKQDLLNRTDLSGGEIDQILADWRKGIDNNITLAEQQYRETQAEVNEKRETLAEAAGKYGILMFVLMGLGAVAGFFGGALGAPELFVSEDHRKEIIEENKNI